VCGFAFYESIHRRLKRKLPSLQSQRSTALGMDGVNLVAESWGALMGHPHCVLLIVLATETIAVRLVPSLRELSHR
jgi:hypothetical protein